MSVMYVNLGLHLAHGSFELFSLGVSDSEHFYSSSHPPQHSTHAEKQQATEPAATS